MKWTGYLIKEKSQNSIANSADSDEMAHYEPSHLNLHYLKRFLISSTGSKRISDLLFLPCLPSIGYVCFSFLHNV